MIELAEPLLRRFAEKGDLAHVALLLWALAASIMTVRLLRDLALANRRFDAFVRELARFNSEAASPD